MIKETFKLMGYDLDKGLQVDWVKAKVVSCDRPHTRTYETTDSQTIT